VELKVIVPTTEECEEEEGVEVGVEEGADVWGVLGRGAVSKATFFQRIPKKHRNSALAL